MKHTQLAGALALLAFCVFPGAARAVGTVANTSFPNTATVTFTVGGQSQTATSNTVVVTVDEILNVAISDGGNVSVFSPQTDRALTFTVTNTGNGFEAFVLTAFNIAGGNFDPTLAANNPRIFMESNGTPGFQAGVGGDILASTTPSLAPDAMQVVYFVSDIPAGQANGNSATVQLRATNLTAANNGAADGANPGTTYANAGDGGAIDAVVGNSRASQRDQAQYLVSAVTSTLSKASTIIPGPNPVPGATIEYTLTFTVSGAGSVTGAQITDNIPANSTFVPGSITLNAVAVSDAAGFDTPNNRVRVDLSTPLAAPSTQTVVFRVTINP